MGQEAWDDVVVDGFHVVGGWLGDQSRHVKDVSEEEPRFGPENSLFLHGFFDASRG